MKVILSTSMAESSVILPGVRYIIDTGLMKLRRGHWLNMEWTAQKNIQQRWGRAGENPDTKVPSAIPSHSEHAVDSLLREFTSFRVRQRKTDRQCQGRSMPSLDIADVWAVPAAAT